MAGRLNKEDLVRLKQRYKELKKTRQQWEILKKEFGFNSQSGLWYALKKAKVKLNTK